MKFNKAKLAALAMSVFMAVTSIPAVAMADDGTPVHDHSELPVTGYTVDQASIEWKVQKDGTCKVDYQIINTDDDVYQVKDAEAEFWKGSEATCTSPKMSQFRATLFGDVYASPAFEVAPALGHNMVEKDRYILVDPTCEEAGDGYKLMVCSRCGLEERVSIADELQPRGHIWGPVQTEYIPVQNILVDENGVVVLDENGIPELEDPTKDGLYDIRQFSICERDPEHVLEVEYEAGLVVYAKKGVVAIVTDEKNIAPSSTLIGLQFSEESQIPPYDTIELAKCTDPGYYQVTFFTEEGKPISHEWYEIYPHHMPMPVQIEFKSQDDANQCIVEYTEDGGYTIKNISCYLPITYYEVIHCAAAGCPNPKCDTKKVKYLPANGEAHDSLHQISRVEKIAQPEGDHIINTVVYDYLAGLEDPIPYAELQALAKKEDSYITITKNNATCTEPGSVTVSFKCKICKQVIKELVIVTEPLGHVRMEPVGENIINPTCTSEGWYDAVVYCKRCGEVLEKREHVRIPRLKHSNELGVHEENGVDVSDGPDFTYDKTAAIEWYGDVVVDINGLIEKDDVATWFGILSGNEPQDAVEETFAVFADVYTTCEYCGGHKVYIDFADLVVDEVVPQTATCAPGHITLTATFDKKDGSTITSTKTFDYYTSINAFQGRTTHIAGAPAKVQNEDGSYDEVVSCIICGTELSRKHADAPVQPEPITVGAVQNLKAATVGMNKVRLTWDAYEGASYYIILKDGIQTGYTAKTTFEDKNADSEDWNYYWVIPFVKDESGKAVRGEIGNYVWAIGRVLGKVASLTAEAGEEGVALTWTPVENANGYVILSKSGSNTAPFNAPIAVNGTSYTVTGATAGQVQYYWVYATYATEAGNTVVAGAVSPFAWAIAK